MVMIGASVSVTSLESVSSQSKVRRPPSGYSFFEHFPLLLFYDRDKGSALREDALRTS